MGYAWFTQDCCRLCRFCQPAAYPGRSAKLQLIYTYARVEKFFYWVQEWFSTLKPTPLRVAWGLQSINQVTSCSQSVRSHTQRDQQTKGLGCLFFIDAHLVCFNIVLIHLQGGWGATHVRSLCRLLSGSGSCHVHRSDCLVYPGANYCLRPGAACVFAGHPAQASSSSPLASHAIDVVGLPKRTLKPLRSRANKDPTWEGDMTPTRIGWMEGRRPGNGTSLHSFNP